MHGQVNYFEMYFTLFWSQLFAGLVRLLDVNFFVGVFAKVISKFQKTDRVCIFIGIYFIIKRWHVRHYITITSQVTAIFNGTFVCANKSAKYYGHFLFLLLCISCKCCSILSFDTHDSRMNFKTLWWPLIVINLLCTIFTLYMVSWNPNG